MGADSKSLLIFIAEIVVFELNIHIYYASIHNEIENSWNYIEQGLKQEFNLDVINKVGCANFKYDQTCHERQRFSVTQLYAYLE